MKPNQATLEVEPRVTTLTQVGPYRLERRAEWQSARDAFRARKGEGDERAEVRLVHFPRVSAEAWSRFTAQLASCRRLGRRGVAPVLDAGLEPRGEHVVVWIAVEPLGWARPITSYVELRSLSRADRLELFARVCDAVGHAHRRGLVHGSLEGGSCLVDMQGQVRLIDFGLAALSGSGPAADRGEDLRALARLLCELLGGPEQLAELSPRLRRAVAAAFDPAGASRAPSARGLAAAARHAAALESPDARKESLAGRLLARLRDGVARFQLPAGTPPVAAR